jgi:hydrogenase-4 component F
LIGFLLVLPPAGCLALAASVVALRRASLTRYAGVAAAAVALVSGLVLVSRVVDGGDGDAPVNAVSAMGGLLRADALSAFMLLTIGAVGLTATWAGVRRSQLAPSTSYAALVVLFLGAMATAVLTDNLGLLWVTVEATTIATAFLVGHRRTRLALEAAWKYVVLGSVGVAIAFLGIVLLYSATRSAGSATLSWSALHTGQLDLDPSLVRVSAALAILGFATKAGLAPMHSWLPDAHSQAPAPVSGLMSGVLLSVAFYAIVRIQAVAAPVIGPSMMRSLLATAGLLSLTVAALLMNSQRDLKRLLAYSSVEHVGVLAIAAAVGGPLALGAGLLHVFGHGLAKATAFIGAGWILESEGTSRLSELRLLVRRRPGVALPLTAAAAALMGLPPFSLFFSEVAIVIAGLHRGLGWVLVVMVVLLTAAFVATARLLAPALLGAPSADTAAADWGAPGSRLPLVLALCVTGVAGFASGPFAAALTEAAHVLTTTP